MAQQQEFKTVADLVKEALSGEAVEAIVIHKHPFHQDIGYRPEATLGDHIEDTKRVVPDHLLNVVIAWQEVEPYLLYDEQYARTISFTVWSENWILEHCWVTGGAVNCGGQVVRFHRVSRHPHPHNPINTRFDGNHDTSPH